jgi:hypothetical protein
MKHGKLFLEKKNHHPKTKLFIWQQFIKKFSFPAHFLSDCRMKKKENISKQMSGRLQLSSGGPKTLTAPSGAS